MPRDAEYRWFFGFCAASTSFATMCGGVGMSGLPMPRSMMSSPRARLGLQVVDDREHVRRKPLDSVELVHALLAVVSCDDTEAARGVSINRGLTRSYI